MSDCRSFLKFTKAAQLNIKAKRNFIGHVCVKENCVLLKHDPFLQYSCTLEWSMESKNMLRSWILRGW